MNVEPVSTRICECCGSTVGTYRFTVTVEYYQEVDIEAPDACTAARMLQDELPKLDIPEHGQWFGGDLTGYDADGDQVTSY